MIVVDTVCIGFGGAKMKRERLIAERNRNGWSQNSVAKLLDIAEITVRSIENGSRNPSSKLIAKFSYLFEVKPEILFPDIFLPDKDTKRIIAAKAYKLTKEAAK